MSDVGLIPFVKPVRVGNFKLWRSRIGGRDGIEAINVSTLDGGWLVRIPQTYELFAMLSTAYGWSVGEDADARVRGEDFLRVSLSNMLYVSCICNGFYHHAVEMVTTAYANPDILRDRKSYKSFRRAGREVVERFLAWRDGYDKVVSESEPSDADFSLDEQAERAAEILGGDDSTPSE